MRFSAWTFIAAFGVAFLLGTSAGWWYRGLKLPVKPAPAELLAEAPDQPSTGRLRQSSSTEYTSPVPHEADNKRLLSQMLAEQRFLEATALYYQTVQADARSEPELRPILDAYFQNCFENCETSTFLDLIDAWLATFYDDIPVLIRLAEFQEYQGQPETAANTLLLARTYAFPVGHQSAVDQALNRLTKRTDKRLSGERRWVELLGYYEYLAAIDFTTSEFELRRALLYRRLGESARATELLTNLQAADDGSDPEWTAIIDRQLAAESSETAPVEDLTKAIPLERRGSGYLAEITINDRNTLKLLVDTGASMTAVSRESFRRLYRPDLRLLGTQLFNTANGYTRGDVYQVSALALGHERIEEVNVAVLELDTMEDIDGLLGMNVLRQFRFEIDQSAEVMYLERR